MKKTSNELVKEIQSQLRKGKRQLVMFFYDQEPTMSEMMEVYNFMKSNYKLIAFTVTVNQINNTCEELRLEVK